MLQGHEVSGKKFLFFSFFLFFFFFPVPSTNLMFLSQLCYCIVLNGVFISRCNAVVQLFNAVSKHQKDIESKLKEAGKSERKKTKSEINTRSSL